VLCSPGSALNPDISVGIESIQKMLCSNSKEINIRIVLQQLYTMITLCNSHLVFVLYRTVFKPILDLFYSDRDGKKHFLCSLKCEIGNLKVGKLLVFCIRYTKRNLDFICNELLLCVKMSLFDIISEFGKIQGETFDLSSG